MPGLQHPGEGVVQGHVGAADRGGAGAPVGLQHVAVHGHLDLPQDDQVADGPQRAGRSDAGSPGSGRTACPWPPRGRPARRSSPAASSTRRSPIPCPCPASRAGPAPPPRPCTAPWSGPCDTSTDPGAKTVKSRSNETGRSSSRARPSAREGPRIGGLRRRSSPGPSSPLPAPPGVDPVLRPAALLPLTTRRPARARLVDRPAEGLAPPRRPAPSADTVGHRWVSTSRPTPAAAAMAPAWRPLRWRKRALVGPGVGGLAEHRADPATQLLDRPVGPGVGRVGERSTGGLAPTAPRGRYERPRSAVRGRWPRSCRAGRPTVDPVAPAPTSSHSSTGLVGEVASGPGGRAGHRRGPAGDRCGADARRRRSRGRSSGRGARGRGRPRRPSSGRRPAGGWRRCPGRRRATGWSRPPGRGSRWPHRRGPG